MDYSVLIGRKVVHGGFRGYGEGTIVALEGKTISVEFGDTVKKFSIEVFTQHFSFTDDETRELINAANEEILAAEIAVAEAAAAAAAIERAAEEAARIAEEAAAAERALAAQRDRQHNHNRIEHDNSIFNRTNDDTMYFLVFQRDTFDIESADNYIWAPTSDSIGVWRHYWERLTQLRKGDVILHCCRGEIRAASVVGGPCYNHIAPPHSVYDRYRGKMGRKVDSNYSLIPAPIRTSDYRSQIMATYPKGSHYAPFNKNGGGNQGYLYELDAGLATTFLNDIMKKNPGWHI